VKPTQPGAGRGRWPGDCVFVSCDCGRYLGFRTSSDQESDPSGGQCCGTSTSALRSPTRRFAALRVGRGIIPRALPPLRVSGLLRYDSGRAERGEAVACQLNALRRQIAAWTGSIHQAVSVRIQIVHHELSAQGTVAVRPLGIETRRQMPGQRTRRPRWVEPLGAYQHPPAEARSGG